MSTNFYLHRDPDPCPTCGNPRRDSVIHIGLSAAGWVFLWRGWRTEVPAGQPLTTPTEWLTYLAERTGQGDEIRDEYGQLHNLAQFTSRVVNKREPRGNGAPPSRHSELNDGMDDCVHVEGDDVAFHEFS